MLNQHEPIQNAWPRLRETLDGLVAQRVGFGKIGETYVNVNNVSIVNRHQGGGAGEPVLFTDGYTLNLPALELNAFSEMVHA